MVFLNRRNTQYEVGKTNMQIYLKYNENINNKGNNQHSP